MEYDINNKTELFTATIETLLDHHPNFEEMQEAEANCRFEVNKINPKALIYKLSALVKTNKTKDKFSLLTNITFKNG